MQGRSFTIAVLAGAGALGAAVGIGSLATTPAGRSAVANSGNGLAAASGLTRRRPPQPGDDWGGCNDARLAGTAPIYRGEPGYRDNMDGDGDGVACEQPRN